MLLTKNKIISLVTVLLISSFSFAVSLDITSPTTSNFFKSDLENFNFGGIVADPDGIVFVAYSNTANGEMSAVWLDNSVSSQWLAVLPLEFGTNIINVWAEDINEESAYDSITVALGNKVSVKILQPTSAGHIDLVGEDSVTLAGTASGGDYDISSVACLQYYYGGTNVYSVTGTSEWELDVSLYAGSNLFEITAKSSSGKKGSDAISISFVDFNIKINNPTDNPIGYINTNFIEFAGEVHDELGTGVQVNWLLKKQGSATPLVNGSVASAGDKWAVNPSVMPNYINEFDSWYEFIVYAQSSGLILTDKIDVLYTSSDLIALNFKKPVENDGSFSTSNRTVVISGEAISPFVGLDQITWSNLSAQVGGSFDNIIKGNKKYQDWFFDIGLKSGNNIISVSAKDIQGAYTSVTISVTRHLKQNTIEITTPIVDLFNIPDSYTTIAGSVTFGYGVRLINLQTGITNSTTAASISWSFDNVALLSGATNFIIAEAFDVSTTNAIAADSIRIIASTIPVDYFGISTPATNPYDIYGNPPPSSMDVTGWISNSVDSIRWSLDSQTGIVAINLNSWQVNIPLPNATNDVTFVAFDEQNKQLNSVTLRVIKKTGVSPVIDILANWPRFLQKGQTGFVEFISVPGQNYQLFYGAVGSNELLATPFSANSGHSVLAFNIVSPLFVENTENIPLLLATQDGDNPTSLPRPITTVPDAPDTDAKGIITLDDIDGDKIYIKLSSKAGNTMKAQGRSVVVSGSPDPKAKVTISVKPTKGLKTTDRTAHIDLVQAPALKMVSMKGGDIDEIIVEEALGSVKVSGGNLGYNNNSWTNKGLTAKTDTKMVAVKGSKTYGGKILGDIIIAEAGAKYKGTKIIASSDIDGADIHAPIIAGISTKTSILNSSIVCDGELKKLSTKIDLEYSYVKAATIKSISVKGQIIDTIVIATQADIKNGYSIGKISALSITDSKNTASNYADRCTQFIAGLKPENQISNLYNLSETTEGTIIGVKTKSDLQGLFIVNGKYNNKKTSIKGTRADTWIVDSVDEEQWSGE